MKQTNKKKIPEEKPQVLELKQLRHMQWVNILQSPLDSKPPGVYQLTSEKVTEGVIHVGHYVAQGHFHMLAAGVEDQTPIKIPMEIKSYCDFWIVYTQTSSGNSLLPYFLGSIYPLTKGCLFHLSIAWLAIVTLMSYVWPMSYKLWKMRYCQPLKGVVLIKGRYQIKYFPKYIIMELLKDSLISINNPFHVLSFFLNITVYCSSRANLLATITS